MSAEIQHAVTQFRDAAGAAHDALEVERLAERVNIADAVGGKAADGDGIRRRSKIHASVDDAGDIHIRRRGGQAARTDGQHAGRPRPRGGGGREGAQDRRRHGAVIIKDDRILGVVAKVIDDPAPIECDRIARGDLTRSQKGDGAGIDDEALGRIGSQRDQTPHADGNRPLIHGRPATVGVHAIEEHAVGAALHERHPGARDDAIDDLRASALRVDEKLWSRRGQGPLIGRSANDLGGATVVH